MCGVKKKGCNGFVGKEFWNTDVNLFNVKTFKAAFKILMICRTLTPVSCRIWLQDEHGT